MLMLLTYGMHQCNEHYERAQETKYLRGFGRLYPSRDYNA